MAAVTGADEARPAFVGPRVRLAPARFGVSCALALLLAGCGGDSASGGAQGDDAAMDGGVQDVGAPPLDVASAPDVAPDVAAPLEDAADSTDAAPDTAADVAADTADPQDAGEDADASEPPGPPRTWNFRAIGGVSMGAAAAFIGLQNPKKFDVVGALGGYINFSYFVPAGRRLHLGGFCPLDQLEAAADLNDPLANPPVTCGPVPAKFEYEFPQDWNHLHFDDDGKTFDREFYVDVLQQFMMAFGNFSTGPGESAYLPAGVSWEWWHGTAPKDRCDAPPPVPFEASFNAEYNPTGAHPVIPFCDGGKQVTPGLALNEYDPAAPHDRPVDVFLAVDINENGRRDLGEPILVNAAERWSDGGVDGCPSPREDGLGGCLPPEAAAAAGDPNGDDYHWWTNPEGTEGNEAYDDGEPFDDLGVDGVAASVSGVEDQGEGNGVYDYSSAFDRMRAVDALSQVRSISAEDLADIDFWFDGGIRDTLHSLVATRQVAGALHARGEDIRVYHNFAGAPDSLLPDSQEDAFISAIQSSDISPKAVGKHVLVEYGDPNATQEKIDKGDGKHVGSPGQALNRIVGFLAFAARRMPDPDIRKGGGLTSDLSQNLTFYSPAMKARRNYTAIVPPGYNDPAFADLRYPVIFMLHGHGQEPSDLAPASIALAPFMIDGQLARVMVVVPDGSCCWVDSATGQRECACRKGPSGTKLCMDPTCTGPHESCEERSIPSSQLSMECHDGSLYLNLLSNRWGEERDDLRYMDSVVDLIDEVDLRFRTRAPETLP